MNRRQIGLKLVLNALGFNPTMTTFDERLRLQKTIYLVQQMGVALGYHFSWYLRGPYSRDLTADVFENLGTEVPPGWTLSEEQKKTVAHAKQLIDVQTGGSSRELEKIASILYVIRTRQESANDCQSITARMQRAGKDYSQTEVDNAVRQLREYQLISV